MLILKRLKGEGDEIFGFVQKCECAKFGFGCWYICSFVLVRIAAKLLYLLFAFSQRFGSWGVMIRGDVGWFGEMDSIGCGRST